MPSSPFPWCSGRNCPGAAQRSMDDALSRIDLCHSGYSGTGFGHRPDDLVRSARHLQRHRAIVDRAFTVQHRCRCIDCPRPRRRDRRNPRTGRRRSWRAAMARFHRHYPACHVSRRLAGLLLSFTLSLDDVIISLFVQRPGTSTLPIYILSSLKAGLKGDVAALAVMMLAVASSVSPSPPGCSIAGSRSLTQTRFERDTLRYAMRSENKSLVEPRSKIHS